jgi:hypothetical protein
LVSDVGVLSLSDVPGVSGFELFAGGGAGDLDEVDALVAAVTSFVISEVAFRNSRIARPNPAPSSGSLPGPKMISTTTSRITR